MVNIRLIKLLKDEKKYVACHVLLQWLSLLARLVAVYRLSQFAEGLYGGHADLGDAVRLFSVLAFAGAAWVLSERLSAHFAFKAGDAGRRRLWNRFYDKILSLGASYREYVTTSELVSVGAEEIPVAEKYFCEYLPRFYYGLLAAPVLFAATAIWADIRTALL